MCWVCNSPPVSLWNTVHPVGLWAAVLRTESSSVLPQAKVGFLAVDTGNVLSWNLLSTHTFWFYVRKLALYLKNKVITVFELF